MTRPIGYYVHHHGAGHRRRALAIAAAFGEGMTLIGTGLEGATGAVPCLDLPDDRMAGEGFAGRDHAERPPALHYAPVDHDGVRRRVAALAGWIAAAKPRLLVIDVSVEIAMLARLASVPTVYVRLSGNRHDRPHGDAFAGATALLAPFHAALDDADVPDAIRARSFYAPEIVPPPPPPSSLSPSPSPAGADILVVIGGGGRCGDGEAWAAAARAVSGRSWEVIGPCSRPRHAPPNLSLRGWVEDADRRIARAGVVIGAAGDGLVGAVLAHRRPFICLPEPRPFDEQVAKARRLAAIGAAVVPDAWPADGAWPALVETAVAQRATWPAALAGEGGARRVACWLERIAA